MVREAAGSDGGMRLNLGCGNYPLTGWTNVDRYCPAEITDDVLNLSFPSGSVAEVRMSHLLEHLTASEGASLLHRIHTWLEPNGLILIEVPDMAAIMERGDDDPMWHQYIYGQAHIPGEQHKSGYTREELGETLWAKSFREITLRTFLSDHEMRRGMPCLEAVARK